MASGESNQLVKQVGEYLVASELARRDYISATFSGNVPYFDIIATNSTSGKSIPIQVKTIKNGGAWQFSIDKFIEIEMVGNKQILKSVIKQPMNKLITVFVNIGLAYGQDEFYILHWETAQKIIINSYSKYLEKHGGERPNKKESKHCSLTTRDLQKYKDNWKVIKI